VRKREREREIELPYVYRLRPTLFQETQEKMYRVLSPPFKKKNRASYTHVEQTARGGGNSKNGKQQGYITQ